MSVPTAFRHLESRDTRHSVLWLSRHLETYGRQVKSFRGISLLVLVGVGLWGGAVAARPNESIATVDVVGRTGLYSSMALDASGNPVISYYDRIRFALRLVHCNDADCAGQDETPLTVDATSATGQYTSLVLDASGNPVIAYYDTINDDLRLAHRNNPGCVGGDESLVTVDGVGVAWLRRWYWMRSETPSLPITISRAVTCGWCIATTQTVPVVTRHPWSSTRSVTTEASV